MNVAAEGSLNQSINKAQRHYTSLFFLPSFNTTIITLAVLCIMAGASSIVFFPSTSGLFRGLLMGVTLFLANFVVDVFLSRVLKSSVFVLRRILAVSMFSWVFWVSFLFLGAGLGVTFGFTLWVKLCLLGFAALLTLRTIVFFSVLSANIGTRLTAILLQPFVCIVPFAILWAGLNVALVNFVPFLVIGTAVACIFAFAFIKMLDRIGAKTYGVPSMSLFQAFMLNWVLGLNAPLEGYLEKMGEDVNIDVSLLKFDSSKPKAAIITPFVHPGPFKNIGSSILPSLMKQEYEKEYGCVSCVPLGLLGHELDAASQAQNYKIISQVIHDARFEAQLNEATPFIAVSENGVTVSCQLFGKTAFLTFTLAPKTTEDLPQELGNLVSNEASKIGLDALVINAHNSITENNEIEASLETLRDTAVHCLKKAVSQKAYPFEIGSHTVYPSEFTLKDGMGAGGITAIVVKVGNQKTAYVVVDGNNMISGMREKILSALGSAGFQESEVFTTDTHSVSAIVIGRRGYHPVGEAVDQNALIRYITTAASEAASNLETCKAGYKRVIVQKVRVIGSNSLKIMTTLVDKAIQKAKHIVIPIFGLEGLLLIILLLLL